MNNIKTQRLTLLDGFRSLAILAVFLFHFTYRYSNTDFYPYKDFYGTLFRYGYLGVSFFFIISGFVISFTLENTESSTAFFKNRFIRLFPPMLLCSVITFCFFLLFDKSNSVPEAHSISNFLLSLTFVPPYVPGRLLNLPLNWLSGSYWSLWVEVQFYVIACLVFFTNRQKYFSNMLLIATIISILSFIALLIYLPSLHTVPLSLQTKGTIKFWTHEVFSLSSKIQYFAVGIIFFRVYNGQPVSGKFTRLLVVAIGIFFFIGCRSVTEVFFHLVMLSLFLMLVYRPKAVSLLQHPLLVRIGVLSYTIYLIHELIGLLLIKEYGALMGAWSPAAPFLLLIFIVLFAELSYRVYEKPIIRLLKRVLFKKKLYPASTHTADNTVVPASPITV